MTKKNRRTQLHTWPAFWPARDFSLPHRIARAHRSAIQQVGKSETQGPLYRLYDSAGWPELFVVEGGAFRHFSKRGLGKRSIVR